MFGTPTTTTAFDTAVDAPSACCRSWASVSHGMDLPSTHKTRLVDFRPKRLQARHPETDGTTFDFLGLTHVWDGLGTARRWFGK